jgi:hypothetical protein
MEIHLFTGKGFEFGFTPDPSGNNLPAGLRPWVFFRTFTVNRGDAQRSIMDNDVCLDDIEKFGFHLTEAGARITDKVRMSG